MWRQLYTVKSHSKVIAEVLIYLFFDNKYRVIDIVTTVHMYGAT